MEQDNQQLKLQFLNQPDILKKTFPQVYERFCQEIEANPDKKSVFHLKYIEPARYDNLKRKAWSSDYYFDDFYRDVAQLHLKGLNLDDLKEEIKFKILFVARVIMDNGNLIVALKTNRITKFSVSDYTTFKKTYSVKAVPFFNFKSFIEVKKETVTKTGKRSYITEEIPVNYWIFDDLTATDNYVYFNYNWMPFRPGDIDPLTGDIIFNSYLGLQAKVLPEYNPDIVNPILDYIEEILANNNEVNFIYIMSWLASLVQEPCMFLPFLIILGERRCGKSTFFMWFVLYVIGACGYNAENLDSILAKFNGHINQRLFIHIKELKGSSHDSSGSIHDKMESLKSKITDNVTEMEKKRMDRVPVSNYAKFAGVGNLDNGIPIKLAPDDKERFALFLASNKRIGDRAFFTKAKEIMPDLPNKPKGQESADHFLTYLLQYKIEIDVRQDIPITEMYQAACEVSVKQSHQFVNLLKSGDYKLRVPTESLATAEKHTHTDNIEYYCMRKLVLYSHFLQYCEIFRISYKTPKETFWLEIKGLFPEWRQRKDKNGDECDISWYLISKNYIYEYHQPPNLLDNSDAPTIANIIF